MWCGQSFLLAFYIIKFLITFCVIVAMNANIERLRAGNIDAVLGFVSRDAAYFVCLEVAL